METAAYFYDAEGRDSAVPLDKLDPAGLEEQQLLWVDAFRGDGEELRPVLGTLAVGGDALGLALEPPPSARLVGFEEHFQFSLPLPSDGQKQAGRLDFLIGRNWLITIRDREVQFLKDYREQDRGESLKGKLSALAVAVGLLEWHLEGFATAISEIHRALDKLDEKILAKRSPKPPLATLAQLRQRVSRLRDAVDEHRPVLRGLVRPDFLPVADSPDADLLCAVEGHYDALVESVAKAREAVVGSFELFATRTAQDTNDLVKVLTIATVIIGAAGAIAGIFGMNFDTAFAHWGATGFFIAIGAMVALALAMLAASRWRGWL